MRKRCAVRAAGSAVLPPAYPWCWHHRAPAGTPTVVVGDYCAITRALTRRGRRALSISRDSA
ncbi:hypothetical protein O7598_20280 [Micromonospora sp. WMMC241]|uniref:hypothetical protein n=1 Tax=Micromonospora sp. WMMC241 TaxID=3015159 RepID=UPI0022B71E1C|nr:hypothetical protein [Micromonospora sp. WMMC241]MCZ7438761.1 hypothetical protein [Micromonospora sp. WMMC241]